MGHFLTGSPRSFIAVGLFAVALSGCADFHLPRIDPSGNHLFVETPPVADAGAPLLGPVRQAAPIAEPYSPSQPTFAPPPLVPAIPATPAPDTIGGVPPASSVSGTGGPHTDRFVSPDDPQSITLTPNRVVKSIGSTVVMVAGVVGGDGYLRTNQRLEWTLARGSVGGIVAVNQNNLGDVLVGDFNQPRKVNDTYAIGSTLRRNEVVAQSPAPGDQLTVASGQGWLSVSSRVEGVTQVVVAAPQVVVPAARTQSALIYWVDAQFGYPKPVMIPAGGKQVLVTTVLRQSTPIPRAGWIVRYEIAGGAPAGFSPNGAAAVEIATNNSGQSGAEIFQKAATPGVTQVRVQVIRPVDQLANGERVVAGSTSIPTTWSAPSLAVRQSGPTVASVGSAVTYRMEISNPGTLPASGVVATCDVPDGLGFVSSNPPPVVEGKRLKWSLGGDLPAGRQQIIDVTYRATQQGSVAHCVEVTAAGGLHANQCATTNVITPMLDVAVTGPAQAAVGSKVVFSVVITNRGQVPATALTIKDRFDEGFVHSQGASPLDRQLGDINPGQFKQITLNFTVAKPGQLCHTVEVTAADGSKVTKQACLTALDAPARTSDVPHALDSGPARQPGIAPPDAASSTSAAPPSVVGPPPARPADVDGSPNLLRSQNDSPRPNGLGANDSNPHPRTDAPMNHGEPSRYDNSRSSSPAVEKSDSAPPIRSSELAAPAILGPPNRGNSPTPAVSPPRPASIAGPPVIMNLSGPTAAIAGQSVTLSAAITNVGSQTMSNIKVAVQLDPALSAASASQGYHWEAGSLAWEIASLAPGETNRLRIEANCPRAAAHACNHFVAMVPTSDRIDREICLEVRPAPATVPAVAAPPDTPIPKIEDRAGTIESPAPGLAAKADEAPKFVPPAKIDAAPKVDISPADRYGPPAVPKQLPPFAAKSDTAPRIDTFPRINSPQKADSGPVSAPDSGQSGPTTAGLAVKVANLDGPVALGSAVRYMIRVTNQTSQPQNNVIVTARLPAGVAADPSATMGPDSLPATIDDGAVRFLQLPQLAPGQTVVYRLRVGTRQPGPIGLHVEAESRQQTQPAVDDNTVEVQPDRN